MSAAKPLAERLAECEQRCAAYPEKEWLPVAKKGLRVLPGHHAELAASLSGQEPRADGWALRSDVIGAGNWLLLVGFMAAGVAMIFVSTFNLCQRTAHPFLYATSLTLPISALMAYAPLRMLMRSHELVFGDDASVVRRRVFGRLDQEWRLPSAAEVRVGLAYRGARARRRGQHGGSYAQLSVVVSSDEAEIVLGADLHHAERARLAILIDHYYNGSELYGQGPENPRVG
ncbi:MAG: hypothetical protein FJ410_03695 [Verrucomicrobia bacterium]|nr:hypothetical protein [Verrucomicrobiota bacterium]